jgi:protocatechuate 3,4-dioxygenase beta subunit
VRRDRFIDGYAFPEEPWDPELTLVFGQRVMHDIPMSRGLAVSGRVVDTEGSPIRGVGLMTMVTSDRHQYGHTEADGSFTLMGYRTGDDVTINAEKDGYALALSGPIPIRDGDVSGVEIVMELEAFVEGVVVDDSGRPLPHAEILARAETKRDGFIPTATSGPDGRFVCGKLGTGSYAFSVQPHNADRSVETDTVVSVTGGDRIEGIRIVYPSPNAGTGYRITGRVIGENGNPIAGVTVRGENHAAQSYQSVTSNGEGEFELTGLAYLRYNLQVLSQDRHVLSETNGIPAGTSGVEIVAVKPARIPGEIVGTVVRADTGAPIADFDVNPASTVVPVHDPQGRFHLRDVYVGQVPISVRANGYIDGFVLATVKPLGEGPTEVTVRMQPAARLTGVVRNSSGAPVQGARVFAGGFPTSEDAERLPKVESAEDGSFVLDALDPRGALIAVKHASYAPLVEHVVPSVSGSRVHTFTLGSGGAVVGTVTYDGKPAPDSLVWVYMPDLGTGPGFSGRTGPDGTYRIDSVPPGSGKGGARLAPDTAGLDTGEFHQTQQVSIRDGGITRMDFEFLPHSAALEGVVTADGQPSDASVHLFVKTPAGEQQMETSADLSGVFQLDAVPPGEAILKVQVWAGSSEDGSRAAILPVILAADAVTRQDVAFGSGASATVHVANQHDDESLTVAAYFGDVGPIETRSDTEAAWSSYVARLHEGENGEFRLSGLQPGIYTIAAYTNTSRNPNVWLNTRAAHQVIEIENGAEAAVDLRLP